MIPTQWTKGPQKGKGGFAHLHPDFNDESQLMDGADDRVNGLGDR